MAQLPKKSIPLGQPNIVVPAINEAGLQALICASPKAIDWDVIELRLDLLPAAETLSQALAAIESPLLLTPRHPDEGGSECCRQPGDRFQRVQPLLACAAAMDIEIAHVAEMTETIAAARDEGVQLILSAHDFQVTPDRDTLHRIVARGVEHGADVVKIAVTANDETEVDRLLDLFEDFTDQPLALMAMGPHGKQSRLDAAIAGSVLNYCCHGEATVEGQWPAADFANQLTQRGLRER